MSSELPLKADIAHTVGMSQGAISRQAAKLTFPMLKVKHCSTSGTDNRFPNDPIMSTFAPPIALAKLEGTPG
jgi:hypothetical protein